MALSIFPLETPREEGSFDLFAALQGALSSNGMELISGDIVVVSAKYVSISQGRTVSMDGIRVSRRGRSLARQFRMKPVMGEMVVREADYVAGGIPGFVLAGASGIMAPNAGIDTSNARRGTAILYPADPSGVAERLRRKAFLETGAVVGTILSDSRLMPGRVGTTGVAVACAGMEPVTDMRGDPDLDGSPLKVTFGAVADSLASAANHTMGEGAQSRPFAIARGSGARLSGGAVPGRDIAVEPEACVYVRGLAGMPPSGDLPGPRVGDRRSATV